jgi:hypothetical protein
MEAVVAFSIGAAKLNAVPESRAGVASGINNAVSRLASLIAVASFGALLVVIFTHALDHRLALLNLSSEEAAQIHANRLQLAAIKAQDTRAVQAITASFIQAYRSVLWIAACSVLAGHLRDGFSLSRVELSRTSAELSSRNGGAGSAPSHLEILIDLPRLKHMLEPFHVDPYTAETDPFQLETSSLLLCSCPAEFYLAARAQNSMPR